MLPTTRRSTVLPTTVPLYPNGSQISPVSTIQPVSPGPVTLSPRLPSPVSSVPSIPLPVPSPQNSVVNIPSPVRIPSPGVTIPSSPAVVTFPSASGPRVSPVSIPTTPPSTLILSEMSSSRLPTRRDVQLMNENVEIRDYQSILSNASLERELLDRGYSPTSKIVVEDSDGEKHTEYIKATNSNGQTVFILVDANGYTTARDSDLTMVKSNAASIVPYSMKSGAYSCASKESCGVAFECGSDSVCVLTRGADNLSPQESNFVYSSGNSDQDDTASLSSVMTYPVVKLTEMRASPEIVLRNSDRVTRSLRNTAYSSLQEDLRSLQDSINKLNSAYLRFDQVRTAYAPKINNTLRQLEEMNAQYKNSPPTTDSDKQKYLLVQKNMARRNEHNVQLLKAMKHVSDERALIEESASRISDLANYLEHEFKNVESLTP